MSDFLAENSHWGTNILLLVSRGNAIIAELSRLKDYVPKVYRLETKQDVEKYGELIFDFSHLKASEVLEQNIENNKSLRELDEEFRVNHIEIISRFYLLFEAIHCYVTDLNHFISELEDGVYIHQNVETVFLDHEGKQILCEALFLYGLMLLMLDFHIDGVVRERMLISYDRYTPQQRNTRSSFDEVCKLLMDTGFQSTRKPANYPELYFNRIPINSTYIEMVISRLRSDDIYSQTAVYPLSRHKSTAFATQASMLYVCLFFCPKIMHSESAVMREIVDKYFYDGWIVALYMGFVVNLIDTWDNFKSAKQALNNTLEIAHVRSISNQYGIQVPKLLKLTNKLLKEGNVTRETLLKNINSILNVLRECNVILRWLILHTTNIDKNKRIKQYKDLVVEEVNCKQSLIFELLLNTAQLELLVKTIYKNLMSEKDRQWDSLKEQSSQSLLELSEVFSGTKPLTRIKKNSGLEKWCLEISKQIQNMVREEHGSSSKLVKMIQALEEVQGYHEISKNMQVIQFLSEVKSYLDQMVLSMNIKEDVLINLQIIADISYAWELIDFYTGIMQSGIKKDPSLVIKLRCVFLKLASALELPLLRINHAHSDDMVSVSEYYSKELEIYVRKVLQIIPNTMFEKLARIIEMQTKVIKELPGQVDKDKLKEYAQLHERFEFAELTNSVSVFSRGMRMMENTLVGVVCLDPKKLLEDGIRKELVQKISKSLDEGLIFSPKPKSKELELKLQELATVMDGYKRSFEYIQDYININGLKIWQEEITRLINYNVEQECNSFFRNKVHPWQSAYQNRIVPIPIYPPQGGRDNFIGRLAGEIIRLTDSRNAVYLSTTSSWYDIKTHQCIFSKETIYSVAKTIEITGLVGLDRLFSFMIINALQSIKAYLEIKNTKTLAWIKVIQTIHSDLKLTETWQQPLKNYQNLVYRSSKIWQEFLEQVLLIGQLQLLRTLVAFHLNKSCKFNAKILESSLRILSKSILLDLKQDKKSVSEDDMQVLSKYFDYAGLNEPFNKVYITGKSSADYGLTMFIFVLAHVKVSFLPQNLSNLSRRSAEQLDGTALSIGVHTIIKQFNSDVNEEFIKQIAEFIMKLSKTNGPKNPDISEVILMLNFMDSYTNLSKASQNLYKKYLPEEILFLLQSFKIV